MYSTGRGASLAKSLLLSPKKRQDRVGAVHEEAADAVRGSNQSARESFARTPAASNDADGISPEEALRRWRARHGLKTADDSACGVDLSLPHTLPSTPIRLTPYGACEIFAKVEHDASPAPSSVRVGALELLPHSPDASAIAPATPSFQSPQSGGTCNNLDRKRGPADTEHAAGGGVGQELGASPPLRLSLQALRARARERSTSPDKKKPANKPPLVQFNYVIYDVYVPIYIHIYVFI